MPRPTPEHLHDMGRALAYAGRFSQAAEYFQRVLKRAPGSAEARYDLALALLGQGRYREGFAHYGARHDLLAARPRPVVPFPQWTGEPLAGKALAVFPEQGFGDQIQMARFAPVLKAMGCDVTWLCAPALTALFQDLGVRVLAAAGAVEFPDPDYWCLAMDLPGLLKITPQTIPSTPYLGASALPQTIRVGMVRRGKPSHANDAVRSLPNDLTLPFAALDLSPEQSGARDFAETARIIAGLDVVVSVDTAIAHLAGAMGKPCCLLLSCQGADWRWFQSRTDSPWYPSMRLYRQAAPGDWATVLRAVADDLPRFQAWETKPELG